MAVVEALTEEECYLWAILEDKSGLDLGEFVMVDEEQADGCWRAWAFQWAWYRCNDTLQVDKCARAVGKSQSIAIRAFIFPFAFPGNQMVITAPELVHLEPITKLIEEKFYGTHLGRAMLQVGRSAVTHRPFQMSFRNGATIIGRIPQRDGKGCKGCPGEDTPILTSDGFVMVQDLKVGDLVLSHSGKWETVTGIYPDVNDSYEVIGSGSFPLQVSCDHKFYGAEKWSGPKEKRNFSPLGWHDVEFLEEHEVYWASPTQFPKMDVELPSFSNSEREFSVGGEEFWWLTGRYLADGYLSHHRPNGKSGSVHWTVVPERQEQIIQRLKRIGLNALVSVRDHSSANIVTINSSPWNAWLEKHFGKNSHTKNMPAFALGMDKRCREALLAGYLSGDGSWNGSKNRWEVGTASKLLAVSIQLLAQSIGYKVTCCVVQPKTQEINGVALKSVPRVSWRLHISEAGHAVDVGEVLINKVKSVKPIGKQKVYDIRVSGDHSYVTGSIISHNLHPLWLELDEGQDYPTPGWVELVETLKRGKKDAVWRAHGVTRGVRDYFYKITSDPNNKWTVHQFSAMHRPNWSDEERQEKIDMYGGRDDPDYRRNILGEHGDSVSPIFVFHRLMQGIDDEKGSEYNLDEYFKVSIKDSMLEDLHGQVDVLSFLNFPSHHLQPGRNFYIGMDVGFTNHPSEILVFTEEPVPLSERKELKRRGKACPESKTRLKLLTRITLVRIGSPDQVKVMLHAIGFYKPKAFSMDSTGVGLPLFQEVQEKNKVVATTIKPYNFSSKILVDFDQTIEVDDWEDQAKKAGIERNVVEYATDCLRRLVDDKRLWLPWDEELIGEFQGQTYRVTKTAMNQYGKKEFSQGRFHALDAARMAVLGWSQETIDVVTKKQDVPVLDQFFF